MTDEEAELWSRLMKTAEPLRRGKSRVVPALDEARLDDHPPRRAAPEPPKKTKTDESGAIRTSAAGPKPAAPPIAGFERRVLKKVAGGRIDIDARIDLHGLTAEEARHRLRGFILSCAAGGARVVLVITGKGRAPAPSDEVIASGQRGVLRRMVPMWLAEPDLRGAVLSFTFAGARHGGDGALYVRLRRQRR